MSFTTTICIIVGLATAVLSLSPNDFEDSMAVETHERNVGVSSQILPNNIFNNGKPFYVEKDPVSGQINFNSKKENDLFAGDDLQNNPISGFTSNDISQIPSNFHDFLNLPVKYSADKFVYPLVSSSYSNLKYQGNNKNFTSNHKNYTTTTNTPSSTTTTTTTPQPSPPNYSMRFGGYKNHTFRPTLTPPNRQPSITLKPRPISTHNIFGTTSTTSPRPEKSTTTKIYTKTPKPYKPSLNGPMVHQFFDEKYKHKYSTAGTSTSVSSTTPLTTTTTTTTTRPTTTTTTTTRQPSTYQSTYQSSYYPTDRPTTIFSSTFRPIPTSIPQFHTDAIPSSSTEGKMTLAQFFQSLGVEEPPNLPLDSDAGAIIELNVNSVNGPSNPQTITIPANRPTNTFPSNSFTIPKPPQIPHRFPLTQIQEQQLQHQQQQQYQQQHNDFMKYDLQEKQITSGLPQLPMNSMSNIIISPGQDSASFVVGSQQSFGSEAGSTNQEGHYVNAPGPQYQYGTVVNDDHYSDYQPQGFMVNKDKNVEENKVSSNIRFPSDNPNLENGQIVNGILKNELNAPVIALPQHQVVVFPPNEKMPVEEVNHGLNLHLPKPDKKVVFKNDKDILSLNTKPSYHTLPEDLTPPNKYHRYPGGQQQTYRPNTNKPPPPPPQFAYNELLKKPGFNRLQSDRPQLPNVLPQFRPNAKVSNKEGPHRQLPPQNGGAVSSQMSPPPFRQVAQLPETLQMSSRPQQQPLQQQPQQQQNRRNPLQNPNRFLNKMAPAMDASGFETNRRVYRVPPPPMMNDRVYGGPVPPYPHPPPRRFVDGYPAIHRNNPPKLDSKSDVFPMPPQPIQPQPVFDNDDFYKMPPALIRRPEMNQDIPLVLEPVVTLQMIQSKKLAEQEKNKLGNSNKNTTSSVPTVSAPSDSKNPLYVVYPVKNGPETDDPVVIGQRGEQPPLPPSKIDFDSKNQYQNTPFQIVRNEHEPILLAKDKNQKPIRAKFPYNLEKPDPLTVAELDRQSHIKKGQLNDYEIFNTGEAPINTIGRVVTKPLPQHLQLDDDLDDEEDYLYGKGTQRPIAIAYTPTEPPKYYDHYPVGEHFSHPNFDGPVIPEILDGDDEDGDKDQYPPYNKDDVDELGFPSRGDNYQQNFQAPFYPSVSLGGTVIKSQYEGWSVVPKNPTSTTTPSTLHQKNQINRSDNNEQTKVEQVNRDDDVELTTRKFDPDTFQPEFEGGFRPIIPSITPQRLTQVSPTTVTTRAPQTTTTQEKQTKTMPPTTMQSTTTTTTMRPPTTSQEKEKYPQHAPYDREAEQKSEKKVEKQIPTTSEKSVFDLLFGLDDDDGMDERRSISHS